MRDLAIQRRENDLVFGTFGRSFYILDDYTPLRLVDAEFLEKEAGVLPIKPALRYLRWSKLKTLRLRQVGSAFASIWHARRAQ